MRGCDKAMNHATNTIPTQALEDIIRVTAAFWSWFTLGPWGWIIQYFSDTTQEFKQITTYCLGLKQQMMCSSPALLWGCIWVLALEKPTLSHHVTEWRTCLKQEGIFDSINNLGRRKHVRSIPIFAVRALKHRDFKEQISGCALIRNGDRFFFKWQFLNSQVYIGCGPISSHLLTGHQCRALSIYPPGSPN